MGLLDQVISSLGNPQQGGTSPLAEIALSLLQQQGGIDGILARFQQAGLGEHAASWVGTGQNMPINASDLSSALGSDVLGKLASRFGLGNEQLAGGLAQALPQLIDQMTPNGSTGGSAELLQQGMSMLGDLLQTRQAS